MTIQSKKAVSKKAVSKKAVSNKRKPLGLNIGQPTIKPTIKPTIEPIFTVNEYNHLFDGISLETKWDKTHNLETMLPCFFPTGNKPKMMDCEALSILNTLRYNHLGLSYKGDVIDLDTTIQALRDRNTIKGVKLAYVQYYNGIIGSFLKGLADSSDVKPYAGKAQGLQILTALKNIRDNFVIFNVDVKA